MVKQWNTEHDAVQHSKQKKKKVFGIDMARVSSYNVAIGIMYVTSHLLFIILGASTSTCICTELHCILSSSVTYVENSLLDMRILQNNCNVSSADYAIHQEHLWIKWHKIIMTTT